MINSNQIKLLCVYCIVLWVVCRLFVCQPQSCIGKMQYLWLYTLSTVFVFMIPVLATALADARDPFQNEKSIIIAATTGKILCEYFARKTVHIHITYSNGIATSFITEIFKRINCDFTYTLYQVGMLETTRTNARFHNLLLAVNYSDYR